MNFDLGGIVAGLVGVVVGAAIQYALGQRAERSRHLQELRTKAYVDFLQAVAAIAAAGRADDTKSQQVFLIALADSKARIAVYGHAQVVTAAADFFRGTAALKTPDELAAFLRIASAMRFVSCRDGDVDDAKLKQLFFGNTN